ncbi:3'-5' exonuclease [Brevundimonas nasdae]|uniref:3'-5' exonuclease n=1 Tax=Brevundimonas nasdae TaxID=172043 RepID=A0ABX8TJW5_9CAUL|nr:3'-5' exonuclease [Brevundimonas nasdae]QYC11496.1 3'-5' exonuclease [Brevundimonas nasdae]QYC14284.1 3'-5' exonuclease [Brevundimonas nasdae]
MDLEAMAAALTASGRYRVLTKLEPSAATPPPSGGDWRMGLFVDVETTGLDLVHDEIIELAMVRFYYGLDGQVLGIGETFQGFREPSRPITPEITALTGIDEAIVRGQVIDPDAVRDFAASAAIVIAHNAAFDRPMLERFSEVFVTRPWGCSMTQIDWASEGADGLKLVHLAAQAGFFYDGHRAANDCAAAIELLRRRLPVSGDFGLARLLSAARRATWRLRAEGAPFEMKDALKGRGYRWDDGSRGAPRAWWVDVGEEALEAEIAFLRAEIYQRDVDFAPRRIDASDRFSARI